METNHVRCFRSPYTIACSVAHLLTSLTKWLKVPFGYFWILYYATTWRIVLTTHIILHKLNISILLFYLFFQTLNRSCEVTNGLVIGILQEIYLVCAWILWSIFSMLSASFAFVSRSSNVAASCPITKAFIGSCTPRSIMGLVSASPFCN